MSVHTAGLDLLDLQGSLVSWKLLEENQTLPLCSDVVPEGDNKDR